MMKKRQGLLVVLAAISIQFPVGVAYIWSVFQTGIANSIFSGNNAAAALAYSLLLAMLSIGSVIGGRLAAKYTTQRVVFIGGIILSLGFFLASFTKAEFAWMLWATYGVMGGLGMGFTYSTTIACAQKWYPHKKGLVTGIIVSAIGLGGAVFTIVAENLISAFGGIGVGELKVFMALSAVYLTVCTIGSFLMKNPPDGYMADATASSAATAKVVKSYTTSEMLKTPQFYLAAATLLLASMGGLMTIGFAKPIAEAKGLAGSAMVVVIAISMTNALGRLIWGIISDKLGRINTILILLIGTAVLALFVNTVTDYWVYVLIAMVGFFYGGIIGTFPSLTADLFGPKNMASNYGFVLLGFGAGAIISSQIAGYFKNVAAEDISLMFPAFVIASCCAGAGIIMMLVIRVMNKRKSSNAV